jgi:hypothetical protein
MTRTATATAPSSHTNTNFHTNTNSGVMGIVPWPDMTDIDTAGWCGSRDDVVGSVVLGGGLGGGTPSPKATSTSPTATTAANPQEEATDRASRAKLVQTQAAASKSGLWGPTHSLDSSESGYEHYQQRERVSAQQREHQQRDQQRSSPTSKQESNPNQGGSAGSDPAEDVYAARKLGSVSSSHHNANHCDYGSPAQAALESIWNRAGILFSPDKSTTANNSDSNPTKSTTLSKRLQVIGEACSNAPCLSSKRKGRNGVTDDTDADTIDSMTEEAECTPICLGIAPMSLDAVLSKTQQRSKQGPTVHSNTYGTDGTTLVTESAQVVTDDSPAARRRARHVHRLVQREQLLTKYDEIEVATDFQHQQDQIRVVSPPTDVLTELRQALPPTLYQLQQQQSQSQTDSITPNKTAPLQLLEVEHEQAAELERSISELTMRSSYGEQAVASRIPDNRRMAYYAVGKHHRNSGRGGNRRCYFTGKLILGGAPFYAGSVQQGLRTLVVFCLPSALGLPKVTSQRDLNARPNANPSNSSRASVSSRSPLRRVASRELSRASNRSLSMASHQSSLIRSKKSNNNGNNTVRGGASDHHGSSSVASKSAAMSRMSSLDDLSLSIDGDLDPNWGLDRDYLLKVLPEPDTILLKSMAKLYPEQFETLPVQVRDATKWKLYVKFCFFSGLPIAQGEMHYKVRDDIAESSYGEEIVLSHDVMEAVNGESAEILSLPNLKAFRYLRKHYAQQCSKLEGGDRVFLRTSWERVLAEV